MVRMRDSGDIWLGNNKYEVNRIMFDRLYLTD